MPKTFFKEIVIIFSCLLFLSGLKVSAQAIPILEFSQPSQPKIISIAKGAFWDDAIYLKGQSNPDEIILLRVKDKNNTFSYSVKTNSDAQGNWSVKLDQPLKSGQYYIDAIAQNQNGVQSATTESGLINIIGTFDLLIGIFSFLVIILLFCFLCIWYSSKSAEAKRYRRIMSSQRDIITSYNILKKDVDEAIKNLKGNEENSKIHEVKFLLDRINGNLEKINKYVVQGIAVIGKYDVVSKIENLFKIKKIKK